MSEQHKIGRPKKEPRVILVNERSRLWKLVSVMSVAGGIYPMSSLDLISTPVSMQNLIKEFKMEDDKSGKTVYHKIVFQNEKTGEKTSPIKLFSISKKQPRYVTFSKPDYTELVSWVDSYGYYEDNNVYKRTSSDKDGCLTRRFKVAETLAMFEAADILYNPYEIDKLAKKEKLPDTYFLVSKTLNIDSLEEADTKNSQKNKRMTGTVLFNTDKPLGKKKMKQSKYIGCLVSPAGVFAVYNIRNGGTEFDYRCESNVIGAVGNIETKCYPELPQHQGRDIIVFGRSYEAGWDTFYKYNPKGIIERKTPNAFNGIYLIPYFLDDPNGKISYHPIGQDLIKLITRKDFEKNILERDERKLGKVKEKTFQGYYILEDGKRVVMFYDGNLEELYQVYNSVQADPSKKMHFEFSCLPCQRAFLEKKLPELFKGCNSTFGISVHGVKWLYAIFGIPGNPVTLERTIQKEKAQEKKAVKEEKRRKKKQTRSHGECEASDEDFIEEENEMENRSSSVFEDNQEFEPENDTRFEGEPNEDDFLDDSYYEYNGGDLS